MADQGAGTNAGLVPDREVRCLSWGERRRDALPHRPEATTVFSERGPHLEWQFATCARCRQSISRFRDLRGGRWYDQWGAIRELADSSLL